MKYLKILIILLIPALLHCEEGKIYRGRTAEDAPIMDVMSQPGSGYVLFRLPANQDLFLLATSGDWVNIETMRGSRGWILMKYVVLYPDDHKFEQEKYWEAKAESLKPFRRKKLQIGPRVEYSVTGSKEAEGYNPVTGLGGGLALQYNFNRNAGLSIEGQYIVNEGDYYIDELGKSVKHKLNYLNIPLLYKGYTVFSRIHLYSELGICYCRLLNQSSKVNGKYPFEYGSQYRENSYGIIFGAGICTADYHLGFRLQFDPVKTDDSDKPIKINRTILSLTGGFNLLNLFSGE